MAKGLRRAYITDVSAHDVILKYVTAPRILKICPRYTVLGDSVNLSARLMAGSGEFGILVGEKTSELSQDELDFNTFDPIKVKGKTALIPIFEPMLRPPPHTIGIDPDETSKIHLPWDPWNHRYGGNNKLLDCEDWREGRMLR